MILYAAKIIDRSPLITYKRWGRNVLIFSVIAAVASRLQIPANNYVQLFLSAIVLGITIVPVFIVINSLLEQESARYAWRILKNTLQRKAS